MENKIEFVLLFIGSNGNENPTVALKVVKLYRQVQGLSYSTFALKDERDNEKFTVLQ